jgi:chromosome condensin MukBEF ATPase and DNA-binding subunit MukB
LVFSQEAFAAAVIAEANEQAAKLGDTFETVGTKVDRIKAKFGDFKVDLGTGIAKALEPAITALDTLLQMGDAVNDNMASARSEIAANTGGYDEWVEQAIALNEQLRETGAFEFAHDENIDLSVAAWIKLKEGDC